MLVLVGGRGDRDPAGLHAGAPRRVDHREPAHLEAFGRHGLHHQDTSRSLSVHPAYQWSSPTSRDSDERNFLPESGQKVAESARHRGPWTPCPSIGASSTTWWRPPSSLMPRR